MKFYIATKLENTKDHNRVRDALTAQGHKITYDWTAHGSVKCDGEERLLQIAALEAEGVATADVVVVLLPGGGGTHAELGMAIALKKLVVVVGQSRFFHEGGSTCVFYYSPTVHQFRVRDWQDCEIGRLVSWLGYVAHAFSHWAEVMSKSDSAPGQEGEQDASV